MRACKSFPLAFVLNDFFIAASKILLKIINERIERILVIDEAVLITLLNVSHFREAIYKNWTILNFGHAIDGKFDEFLVGQVLVEFCLDLFHF